MAYFKKKTSANEAEKELISPESTFEGWYREIFHTGSRVICNPPPTDTDDDYLLLVGEGAVKALEEKLVKEGYTLGGSLHTGGLHEKEDPLDFESFASYKKGHFNVILTCNDEYFLRFKKATLLARELNLLKKEDRVTLFEAVVRDKYPEEKKSGWPWMYTTGRERVRIPMPNWRDMNLAVNPPRIEVDIEADARPVAVDNNGAGVEIRGVNVLQEGNIQQAPELGDIQEAGQAAVNPAVWQIHWGDNHEDNVIPA